MKIQVGKIYEFNNQRTNFIAKCLAPVRQFDLNGHEFIVILHQDNKYIGYLVIFNENEYEFLREL